MMVGVLNSEIPSMPPEIIQKRKRGRPRKSSTIPPAVIPVPVIPKDTTYLTHAPK